MGSRQADGRSKSHLERPERMGWEKQIRQPTQVPDKCPEYLFKGIHHLDTAPRTQEKKQADKYSNLQASVNPFVGAI